ncbi:V-type ATP synthase subunit E [Thermosediminibacter oceani]|uniref:V-type proton ATPase subunit E n=1 Tax=Thermosediminibacter oceani (strain ATCC BAA-1034 / DSM 16646 / JW/IW-1228P) TaxID=555079 RepID=D9RZY6_THEOJ|nr:V-type ATP synthase subunit E [Thermosediminibacter oceani]ADL08763.1 H+transporting two-sector ATPase E subunit [Thermosediminibacter oceani DSM 16646]
MQGIAKIKEKILEEAAEGKNRIIENAKKEAAEILEKAKKKAAELEAHTEGRARKAAGEEKRKILSMAELEERKRYLEAKQALIDQAFAGAEDKLLNLDAERYQDLVYRLILTSAIDGNEEIVVSEADKKRITPELLEKVNNALKKQGKAGNIRLSGEKRPIKGGFILKSATVEINCTFDYLLKIQREELETEVARILFEE